MEFTIHTHDRPEKRTYCGPTVLMLLTGKPREKIHRDVNYFRNNKLRNNYEKRKMTAMVKSMGNITMEGLLQKYDMAPKYVYRHPYKTLKQLADDMEFVKKPIVVTVTGHYVLYYQGMIYDTYRRQGCPVKEHPCARKRVKEYWIINKEPKL